MGVLIAHARHDGEGNVEPLAPSTVGFPVDAGRASSEEEKRSGPLREAKYGMLSVFQARDTSPSGTDFDAVAFDVRRWLHRCEGGFRRRRSSEHRP